MKSPAAGCRVCGPRSCTARRGAERRCSPWNSSCAGRRAHAAARYVLRLYITGSTPHAIVNIRKPCEEHLHGRYELEIVDIAHHPTLAEGEQIIAAPTLIKNLPLPLRRFIGDMSPTEKILLGLDLRETGTKPE